MKNYHSDGKFIEFTAGATITSGMLVKVGSLFGVSVTDVANGAQGSLALEGVFTLPKTAGAGTALTAGGPVYFDTSEAATGAGRGAGARAAAGWPQRRRGRRAAAAAGSQRTLAVDCGAAARAAASLLLHARRHC